MQWAAVAAVAITMSACGGGGGGSASSAGGGGSAATITGVATPQSISVVTANNAQ
jgi:hypothetical protein